MLHEICAGMLVCGLGVVAGCSGTANTPGEATASPSASPSAASPPSVSSSSAAPRLVTAGTAPVVRLKQRERGRIQLASPDWLATTPGALWAKLDGGEVIRVDTRTGDLVARIPPPPGSGFCQGFGAIEDAVYSCPHEGVIQRIDPASNRIVNEIALSVLSDAGRFVTASGRLWAITASARTIKGIDPTDDTVGPPIKLGAFCSELAAVGATVWAACLSDGLLLRVDTSSGKVTGQAQFPGIRQVAAGDSIWVGYDDGVAQVNPDTLKVEALYDIQIGFGGSIYVDNNRVLLRSDGGPFLTAINPATHSVIEKIKAPALPSGGNVIRADGSLWASAYDDTTLVQLTPGP